MVKELADRNVVLLLNNGNHLFQSGGMSGILIFGMWVKVLTHNTLNIHILEMLQVGNILGQFFVFTQNLSTLDFTRFINTLILTNLF